MGVCVALAPPLLHALLLFSEAWFPPLLSGDQQMQRETCLARAWRVKSTQQMPAAALTMPNEPLPSPGRTSCTAEQSPGMSRGI